MVVDPPAPPVVPPFKLAKPVAAFLVSACYIRLVVAYIVNRSSLDGRRSGHDHVGQVGRGEDGDQLEVGHWIG